MLPMLFPHVLSTETKSETTMGFSRNNRLKSESRANGTPPAIEFDASSSSSTSSPISPTSPSTTTATATATATSTKMFALNDKIRLWRRLFVWQLKRRWKQQRLQHQLVHSIPIKSRHHANHKLSIILRINQKTKRSTSRDLMPSGQVFNVRWPNNELCFSAETINRRPRSTCNRMPSVAMARSTLCNRTETNTIMPKRNRPRLCMLQSDTLVPDMPKR